MNRRNSEGGRPLRARGRRTSAAGRPEKPGAREPRKKKKEKHDREEIFEALVKLGHEPAYQLLDGRDQSLIALARPMPTCSST